MNFDKFKKIIPKRIEPPKDDNGYSLELASLKSRPTGKKITPILSACAAAVVIVTVVALWAIIGRGMQIGNVVSPAPSDKNDDTSPTLIKDESITALQREAFFDAFAKYKINTMPEFNEGNLPSIDDMARYIYSLNGDLTPITQSVGVVPNDIFKRDAKTLFGFEHTAESDVEFEGFASAEYPFAELIGYKTDSKIVTATAAVYYMWNLVEQNCEELYPADFAIAKSTVTAGEGNIVDITAIYTIKYLSDDGITPKTFLSVQKCVPPGDDFNSYFK